MSKQTDVTTASPDCVRAADDARYSINLALDHIYTLARFSCRKGSRADARVGDATSALHAARDAVGCPAEAHTALIEAKSQLIEALALYTTYDACSQTVRVLDFVTRADGALSALSAAYYETTGLADPAVIF